MLTGAQKENRVTVSQELFDRSNAVLLSRFGPCKSFLVPKIKILTKRSPISDGRGDRRKFDMGPSCHPAKHVPELEKNTFQNWKKWERFIKSGGEYFERDKSD
jgi:hypothetical protein